MYAGHSSEDGRIQELSAHLHQTAELCAKYAESFGAKDLARLIGLCHDIGKYSKKAQDRILRDGSRVDHSTAGGREIAPLVGPVGAYCVFGHHGGLPDGGSMADTGAEPTMLGRLKRVAGKEIDDYSSFSSEITLARPAAPAFRPLGEQGFSVSFLIRMLFSCLVDADFLDTEAFMTNRAVERGGYQSIAELEQKLTVHLQALFSPKYSINEKRCEILRDCIATAKAEKGLFSLTVPTGGGKTLSSLAFALRHARLHGMERVIYVIPYTSIIEQNAAVFAKILGRENVLEHHSGFEYGNETDPEQKQKLYLSTENWDAPVVVTTNVQFFESLFAAKTSKCRKLHHIANSVIIFDEAQMLPQPYLLACTRAIAELVHNYCCTAVLCSATQPALDGFFPPEIHKQEIVGDAANLYDFFRRTVIKDAGKLTDEELSDLLNECEQVLCIVNTRRQAQNVYRLLNREGSYHLSTLMYPEHRKKILNEIRTQLTAGLPCRVVSTSLIEAGVDVDFPVVYRARTGLDSIIQAAGRCNRENRRKKEDSPVFIFEPDDGYSVPTAQRQPAAILEIIETKYKDLASPQAIHAYFEKLYEIKGDSLDTKRIVSRLEAGMKNRASFPFRKIEEDFRLIENNTYSVLIPNTEESSEIADRLRRGERNRGLLRQVGRYGVNIYENHYRNLREMGLLEILDSELAVLSDANSYRNETGLTLTPESGKAIFVEI